MHRIFILQIYISSNVNASGHIWHLILNYWLYLAGKIKCQIKTVQSNDFKIHGTKQNLAIQIYAERKTFCNIRDLQISRNMKWCCIYIPCFCIKWLKNSNRILLTFEFHYLKILIVSLFNQKFLPLNTHFFSNDFACGSHREHICWNEIPTFVTNMLVLNIVLK